MQHYAAVACIFRNRNELKQSMWEESVCFKKNGCCFSTQSNLYFAPNFPYFSLFPFICSCNCCVCDYVCYNLQSRAV